MLMIEPENTSHNFSNLVIQEYNGVKRIFTVRYLPSQNKSKKSSYSSKSSTESFNGDIQMSSGITTTELWGDDDGGGGGGSGTSNCEEYETVCNTLLVYVPHGCSCKGHMPWENCACPVDGGQGPYYTMAWEEKCEDICKWDNYNDQTSDNNNNSTGSGGNTGSNNNSGPTNVATTPVNPDGTSTAPQALISQLNITTQNQIYWINNSNNLTSVIALWSFGEQNQWSIDANLFAEEAIETLMDIENKLSLEDIITALNYEQDYKNRMSSEELKIFNSISRTKQLGYLFNAQKATWQAENLFPNSIYNGKGDAFRHAYFNALNSILLGVNLAEKLSTAHENKPPTYQYSYKENQMDLFNNAVGRTKSNWFSDGYGSLTESILDAISKGELRYLTNLAGGRSSGQATSSSTLIPTN